MIRNWNNNFHLCIVLTMRQDETLLTARQAAALCGVHQATITRWAKAGHIKPALHIPGSHLVFHIAEVRRVIEERANLKAAS